MSSEGERRLKESYNAIISSVLKEEVPIESVKKLFKEDINSPRSYSTIDSLENLINILEKRCVLDHLNIVPLLKMCCHFGRRELNKSVNEHARLLYAWNQEHRDPVKLESQDYAFECSDELSVKVSDIISQHIGSKWKCFAQGLGLSKKDIELIESNPSSSKVELCLEAFTLKSNFFRRRHDLFQALSYIKRNDIKWKLQEIFHEQNIKTVKVIK